MVSPLNPNTTRPTNDNTLLSPRNTGRRFAIRSNGTTGEVTWTGGQVRIDGVNVFALASEPETLDFAFDQLNRGTIVYRTTGGTCFVYFYDPTVPGFTTLNIGSGDDPAACNDYIFGGVNTVIVYLVGSQVKYRLQADRFTVAYDLVGVTLPTIKRFGIQASTNSLAVLKTNPFE